MRFGAYPNHMHIQTTEKLNNLLWEKKKEKKKKKENRKEKYNIKE
jgi:hypothetical protein